jgi:hypothetical protein
MFFTLSQISNAGITPEVYRTLINPVPVTPEALTELGFYKKDGIFEHNVWQMSVRQLDSFPNLWAIHINDHLIATVEDMRNITALFELYTFQK